MSIECYKLFRVTGGTAMDVWNERHADIRSHRQAISSFVAKHGARNAWVSRVAGIDPYLTGIAFHDSKAVPVGWRRPRPKSGKTMHHLFPDTCKTEGKAIARDIKAINRLRPIFRVDNYFVGNDVIEFTDERMIHPKEVEVAGVKVVMLGRACEAKPIDGLSPMKHSEYYAAKEAAGKV